MRVESNIPNCSVLLHGFHCYNTQSKQQVAILLYAQLNNWHGIISWSLYGLASWHKQLVAWLFHPDYHMLLSMHVKWLKNVIQHALTPKLSLWWHKFKKFLVLWCNIIRKIDDLNLGCNLAGDNSFRKALWKGGQLQYHGGGSQKDLQWLYN